MYEQLDYVWILEQVGGVSEWLGYYVKVWIIEWASEFWAKEWVDE